MQVHPSPLDVAAHHIDLPVRRIAIKRAEFIKGRNVAVRFLILTLPFARFEQLVHRFHDWKKSNRRDDLQIRIFVGPSFDYDLETLRGLARLHARRGAKFQIVNLGGLRIRSGDALVEWIEERRAAGITGFHTSLAGYGEIHDRWNGRAGDFDYQTSILRLAGERRMVVCRACSIARR